MNGSTENYACGGFPAQAALPKGNTKGQYLDNEIWSQFIPWVGAGAAELSFDVYEDLPLDNLLFFTFHVRGLVDGCPSHWNGSNFVYYGDHDEWRTRVFPIDNFLPAKHD